MGTALHAVWQRVARVLHAVTGESKYANYVAHERAAHPHRTPVDERTFWRQQYAEQDASPEGRCC